MPKLLKAAVLHRLNAPATASTTGVTAAFGGEAAGIDPTGLSVSITQPDMPRNVTATFGAGWAATNHIKVYGTDANNAPITETLAANPGSNRTGVLAFKTITKITKAKSDAVAGTNTCSIGTGTVFGVAGKVVDAFANGQLVGTGFDVITVDSTNSTISPATAPNGARIWIVAVNLAAV